MDFMIHPSRGPTKNMASISMAITFPLLLCSKTGPVGHTKHLHHLPDANAVISHLIPEISV